MVSISFTGHTSLGSTIAVIRHHVLRLTYFSYFFGLFSFAKFAPGINRACSKSEFNSASIDIQFMPRTYFLVVDYGGDC
jgi:hypothetical protein